MNDLLIIGLLDELEKIAYHRFSLINTNKLKGGTGTTILSLENPRYGFFSGRPKNQHASLRQFRLPDGLALSDEEQEDLLKGSTRIMDSGLDVMHVGSRRNKGRPRVFTTEYPVSLKERLKRRFMGDKSRKDLLDKLTKLRDVAFDDYGRRRHSRGYGVTVDLQELPDRLN